MPTSNSGSSFNNSCIKVPINPCSGLPCPSYERRNDSLLKMHSRKDAVISAYGPVVNSPSISRPKLSKTSHNLKSSDCDRPLKAFIDFYESIPDYGELTHLSDEEFYRRIQHLKEKQKEYSNSISSLCVEEDMKDDTKPETLTKEVSSAGSNACSDLHSGIVGVSCFDNRVKDKCPNSFKVRKKFVSNLNGKSYAKSRFKCSKPSKLKKHHPSLEASTSEESTIESIENAKMNKAHDDNTASEHDVFESKLMSKKIHEKDPFSVKLPHKKQQKELLNLSRDSSSKSLRKSNQARVSSGSLVDSVWDNFSIDDYYPKSGHSFSDSDSNLDMRCLDCPPPRQIKSVAWRDPKITVPVPFPMTTREKENQEIRLVKGDLYDSKRDLTKGESKGFKTKPIPIESRIPLYDKIMNEQENRRRMVKKQSIENLKASMKPFSFVKREEEEKRFLVTHSSPELRNISNPVKLFKAKPVPKNLFSSHVYQRMREDEYYRTLRKRIRSEELLRSSSLPPSMAAREKANLRRENFTLDEDEEERCPRPRRRRRNKIPNYKLSHDILRMELEGRKNENVTTTPKPFYLETATLREKKAHKCCTSSCKAVSLSNDRNRPASAGPLTLHRNNLASVLRIQSSRDRAEQEKLRKRDERRQREEARLREREFRKDPAWKLVSGWGGVDDDLALRACTRRQEEHLRNQIHRHQMESMMSRVYQIPTLFERQSQVLLSRRAVKEALKKKTMKEQPKEPTSDEKPRKLSVKLQSKEVNSISPTPREEAKADSDESYESDPEDDKTCLHSIGEDIEEGTGLEDEIKDEVAEDEKKGVRDRLSSNRESQESLALLEEVKDMPSLDGNEMSLNDEVGDAKGDVD